MVNFICLMPKQKKTPTKIMDVFFEGAWINSNNLGFTIQKVLLKLIFK